MKKLLATWIINFLSLLVVSNFLSGMQFTDTKAMFMTALALMMTNSLLKPFLKLLAFPLTMMTFGLFSFVVNGIVLIIAFGIFEGASISGLGTAMIAAIALGVVNDILEGVFKDDGDE